jgi:hypothetical protein
MPREYFLATFDAPKFDLPTEMIYNAWSQMDVHGLNKLDYEGAWAKKGFLAYSCIYDTLLSIHRTKMPREYFLATFGALKFDLPTEMIYDAWSQMDVHGLNKLDYEGADRFPYRLTRNLKVDGGQITNNTVVISLLMLLLTLFVLISVSGFGAEVTAQGGVDIGSAAVMPVVLEKISKSTLDMGRYTQAVTKMVRKVARFD